jgi:hypothetical protein
MTHALNDTNRGVRKYLATSSSAGEVTNGGGSVDLYAYNTNGFNLGSSNFVNVNDSGETFASWTFRKQPKFFDVVTYTGNGTAGRTVAHSLGSVPGCIIVKRTNAANGWAVYHRAMDVSAPQDWMMRLNSTDARFDLTPSRWNDTAPTSTVFTLSDNDEVNGSGDTYVAYLFAHDAGGFGLEGLDNVISCGSFTTDGSGVPPNVNLGYEPQWIMCKGSSAGAAGFGWTIQDNMRGSTANGAVQYLRANSSGAENADTGQLAINSTGFGGGSGFGASNTFIYIAIRRGPMKVPTSGTQVYDFLSNFYFDYPVGEWAFLSPNGRFDSINNSVIDLVLSKSRNQTDNWLATPRLTGFSSSTTVSPSLSTNTTGAESVKTGGIRGNAASASTGLEVRPDFSGSGFVTSINYKFARAPGVFDEVCYTGTGSNTTIAHNLQAVPELLIVKSRSTSGLWAVYSSATGNGNTLLLHTTNAAFSNANWNSTTPTSAVFSIGVTGAVNTSGATYVSYLFATLAGVSKVGSYTGNGSSQTINCGFTGGARFVLIKRTDSTGDWYVWDSSRGIVSGNDPHLSPNTTAAEVTTDDSVDTDSTGFVVNQVVATNVNVNTATYIFLAIA